MKEVLLGNKFILYGLIVVFMVFVLIVIVMKLNKGGNYYEGAKNLHKRAEELHILGKDKKADKLNDRAEEYRIKAKEMET